MYMVLFYDVTNDRIRRKISTACEDYGLDRTQFSAYVGDLTGSQQRELMLKLKILLGDEAGALLLIPIHRENWESRVEFRQNAPGDGVSTQSSDVATREEHDGTLY